MTEIVTQGPRVLHRLPGRLRVHLPGWSGPGREQLEQALALVPGVRSAQANPLTGNVLICFDPRQVPEGLLRVALDAAVRALRAAQGVEGAGEAPGASPGGGGALGQGALLRAGLRGLLGHALVDALFYAVTFSRPFGLPLAPLGALHLGLDVLVWGVALAPLLETARQAPEGRAHPPAGPVAA
jgi:hypothetical protein